MRLLRWIPGSCRFCVVDKSESLLEQEGQYYDVFVGIEHSQEGEEA